MANLSEFNQWLQKGLGRAVLHLRTHDPAPYREAVLYACTHDLTYDAQCEGDREIYLVALINCVADQDFFRNGFLEALRRPPKDPEKFDLGQTIELARSFAEKGDDEMKQAMYRALADAGFEQEPIYYEDLIKLDGLPALVIAAEHVPSDMPEDKLWQINSLVTALRDRDGLETANDAIRRAELESPRVAQMLERSRLYESRFEPRENQKRLDYEGLKEMIARKPGAMVYAGWGRTATAEELDAAASDLIVEKDESRLLAYLRIFWIQRFPGPSGPVLKLVDSANVRLARAAVKVLSQLTTPAIRELGLRLLGSPGRQGDGVELLVNNYKPEDFQLMETLLGGPMQVDDLHSFEIGVRHLASAHHSREAERSLLLLYENGPCSLCRCGVVEELIALDCLPEWMREECRHDSDTETRKLVQQ